MFYNCTALKYLDISSFRNKDYCSYYNLFYKVPIYTNVIMHRSFYDKINEIITLNFYITILEN